VQHDFATRKLEPTFLWNLLGVGPRDLNLLVVPGRSNIEAIPAIHRKEVIRYTVFVTLFCGKMWESDRETCHVFVSHAQFRSLCFDEQVTGNAHLHGWFPSGAHCFELDHNPGRHLARGFVLHREDRECYEREKCNSTNQAMSCQIVGSNHHLPSL
jgi:hypothetical protein